MGEGGLVYNNINLLYVLSNLISPANKPFKLEIQYAVKVILLSLRFGAFLDLVVGRIFDLESAPH